MPRKRSTKGSAQPTLRADGRYELKVTVGRNPVTGALIRKTVYGKTAAECAKKARAIAVKVDNNSYSEPCKLTLTEWSEIWLNNYTLNIKDSSRRNYKQHFKNYIKR